MLCGCAGGGDCIHCKGGGDNTDGGGAPPGLYLHRKIYKIYTMIPLKIAEADANG